MRAFETHFSATRAACDRAWRDCGLRVALGPQSLACQRFAAQSALCRLFSNGRLYVQLKMPVQVREALLRGASRSPEGAFGHANSMVEIN